MRGMDTPPLYEAFKKRLTMACKERGLKQKELAAQLGINNTTFSHYTTGTTSIPLGLLLRIADILQVSPVWLGFGNQETEEDALLPDEQYFLARFHFLDNRGQEMIWAMLEQEYEHARKANA